MEQLILENRHTGERLALRRVMRDGVLCLELKGSLPPRNQGPPLHIHHVEIEEGHVLAGTLGAVLDGCPIRLGPGQRATFPAGSTHRWWNESDELLLFEGHSYPLVDLDRYLQAAFEVLNSGAPDRPPLFYMAHLAWRHRHTQTVLFAPRWIQAVLVPAVVLVGTLLGRYDGTGWPGCPDRCIDAPLASGGADFSPGHAN
jgi:mannose-6-phosphate isomerase-like protein (cupin superfamily)